MRSSRATWYLSRDPRTSRASGKASRNARTILNYRAPAGRFSHALEPRRAIRAICNPLAHTSPNSSKISDLLAPTARFAKTSRALVDLPAPTRASRTPVENSGILSKTPTAFRTPRNPRAKFPRKMGYRRPNSALPGRFLRASGYQPKTHGCSEYSGIHPSDPRTSLTLPEHSGTPDYYPSNLEFRWPQIHAHLTHFAHALRYYRSIFAKVGVSSQTTRASWGVAAHFSRNLRYLSG